MSKLTNSAKYTIVDENDDDSLSENKQSSATVNEEPLKHEDSPTIHQTKSARTKSIFLRILQLARKLVSISVWIVTLLLIVSLTQKYIVKKQPFTVELFGDSLVSKTDTDWQLRSMILQRLLAKHKDQYDINIVASGHGGHRVLDLRNRLQRDVLNRRRAGGLLPWSTLPPPDAVIVYWDSDATDVDEDEVMSPTVLQDYKNNLDDVLYSLTSKIRYIGLAGPTLYGERPPGQNHRDHILDTYRDINRNYTERHGAMFLDTRSLFQAALVAKQEAGSNFSEGEDDTCCYLTLEGEHHGWRGAQLVANLFSGAVDQFLETEAQIGKVTNSPAPKST